MSISEYYAGVGFRTNLTEGTEFTTELSLVGNEVDAFGSIDDTGYRVAIGLRGMMTDNFELGMAVSHSDVGDFGKGMGGNLNATYSINKNFGITASYNYQDRNSSNYSTWNLGARYSF